MRDDRTEKQSAEKGGERDENGQFAAGGPGGPGRPKGKPNAVNAVLKDDILTAYLEPGSIAWLRGLSDKDFVRLLEKTMPREIAADVRTAASIEDRQARMTDEDRRKLAEIVLEAIQDELAAVRPAGESTRECGRCGA